MATIIGYASLKTAILDFTHKSSLTSYLDYLIQDAQEEINADVFRENMGNGIKPMEIRLAPVAIDGSGQVAVPADYLSMKSLQLVTGSCTPSLEQKSADWIYDNYPLRTPDRPPAYFAREGSNFIFGPYPNTGYSVQGWYYQLAPMLTSGNEGTHWMVQKAPLMFHAACMVAAAKFLKDSDELSKWMAIYKDKMDKLIAMDKADRWNASGLQMDQG